MPHSGTKTGNQGKTSFERGNTNTVKNGAVSSSPNSSPTRGVNGYLSKKVQLHNARYFT